MSEEGNWRDDLPDEIKGDESLSSFEDITGLAKSYIETKKMVGNSIRIPSEEAGDEQKADFVQKVLDKAPGLMLKPNFEDDEQSTEFFRTLGMPEKPEEYENVKFEETEFPEDQTQFLNELGHSLKLTNSQMAGLKKELLKQDHESKSTLESSRMEQMKALKQEWGLAFDDHKALAEKVRDTFFDFLSPDKMDAATIKALHAVGKQLGGAGEGGDLGDNRDEGGKGGKMTPAEAQGKINDMMNNKDHPYWHAHHPDHQAALDRMVELRKAADPDALDYLPRVGFTGG